MPDRTGQQLSNYRLLTRTGEDNFTEIYLGVNLQTHAQATLKIAKYTPGPADVKQFLTEASRLSQLSHPNIVRTLAYGEVPSTVYLVLGYTSQETLRQLHRRGQQLELALVIRYVKQIASALQYAHDQGIIHGDLRPENLLSGPQRSVLVNNFGLTGLLGSATPYRAPEQVQQPASDQYALAALAYEWLSGMPPLANYQAVHPLCELAPQLPPDIERVIMRALERDWRARFETAKDFAEALEQATTSTFVSRPASTPLDTPSAPIKSTVPPTIAVSQPPSDQIPATQATPGSPVMANAQGSQLNSVYSTSSRDSSAPPPPPAEFFGAFGSTTPSGPYADLQSPSIQYPIYPFAPTAPAYGYGPQQPSPVMYVPAPAPKQPIHFPLTRKAPIYLQIFGMLLYSMLIALCIMGSTLYLINSYHPGTSTGIYTNLDGSINVLSIVLTIVLILLIIPACSTFCGTFFGSWRGLLVSLLSIGGGFYITHLSYNQFWSSVNLQNYLVLAPLPLSALIVGLIYDRRKYAAWWKSMFTLMLGTTTIILWLFVLLLVATSSTNAFTDASTSSGISSQNLAAATDVILGCFALGGILLITLPVAAIEGIIHHSIASAKRKGAPSGETSHK